VKRLSVIAKGSHQDPTSPRGSDRGVVPLDSLGPGQCARVHQVEEADHDLERLMAMGVCAGRKVMLVRRGDPLIVKVLGTRIGLSARLAHRIRVEPCPDGER
jgi:Fe2+ transport system protein FeoA